VLSRWPILHSHNHDLPLPGDVLRGLLHDMPALPGAGPHPPARLRRAPADAAQPWHRLPDPVPVAAAPTPAGEAA